MLILHGKAVSWALMGLLGNHCQHDGYLISSAPATATPQLNMPDNVTWQVHSQDAMCAQTDLTKWVLP